MASRGKTVKKEKTGKTCRIIVSGLKVFAYHGCTPMEKEKGQNFYLDMELEYDCSRATAYDDLSQAVDYDRLVSEVHEIAAKERYDLIETLAARIGAYLRGATPADTVLVRVRKPEAPLAHEVREVAVEMVFEKDG
jgi:dihydroneopterin aldolase